eukprot:maker-scaffold613_size124221-snap-gene-0.32 protein:Tk11740 transcript:maker-scaffold613_size124221-snap-gene-0.32-mRNA-1 annotation:"d-aspartate oxidase-like"
MRVAIIGGGIIGSTTAWQIVEQFPQCRVDMIAEDFSPNTTSDGAAGLWEPHLNPHTPEELIKKWSGDTFAFLDKLWNFPSLCPAPMRPLAQAISLVPGFEIWNKSAADAVEIPQFWSDIVYDYHRMPADDLRRRGYDPDKFDAQYFTSYVFEAQIALPIFYENLKAKQVQFISKRLSSEDFKSLCRKQTYDYIVNCCGAGAKDLFGDDEMEPVRGHVVRVEAPWIHSMMTLGQDVYIIPTRQGVVLGTVDRPNEWCVDPDPAETALILEKCQALCPSLVGAKILNDWMGLRPLRKSGARLELEHFQHGTGELSKVIHNYGHGGSGLTLCIGCANEVVDIISQDVAHVTSH